ncbi:MAG: DUF6338 family protein [Sphaerochaetaceae bacterium]
MNIDVFIFKLAILLVPGFITLQIIRSNANIPNSELRNISPYDVFIMLVISLFIALVFDFMALIPYLHITFSMFDWIVSFDPNSRNPLNALSFLYLLIISIVIGFLAVVLSKSATIDTLFAKLHISSYFPQKDNWTSFAESKTVKTWVHVRDYSKNLIYTGYIETVSGASEGRDIILRDVCVYNLENTEKMLFKTSSLYVPLVDGMFTVEIATIEKKTGV